MTTITTVGIHLTEDERRLLTQLASDLEIREESALRRSDGPEATMEALRHAATEAALRKLMYLPAVTAERVREVVREACELAQSYNPDAADRRRWDSIADRVAAQIAPDGRP